MILYVLSRYSNVMIFYARTYLRTLLTFAWFEPYADQSIQIEIYSVEYFVLMYDQPFEINDENNAELPRGMLRNSIGYKMTTHLNLCQQDPAWQALLCELNKS
jgi:hypothetical protein